VHRIIVIGQHKTTGGQAGSFSADDFATDRRCGNAASILEISPGGRRFFNVFDAAPENERDGPNQAEAQAQKVSGIDSGSETAARDLALIRVVTRQSRPSRISSNIATIQVIFVSPLACTLWSLQVHPFVFSLYEQSSRGYPVYAPHSTDTDTNPHQPPLSNRLQRSRDQLYPASSDSEIICLVPVTMAAEPLSLWESQQQKQRWQEDDEECISIGKQI
jgi:hypothetical protein